MYLKALSSAINTHFSFCSDSCKNSFNTHLCKYSGEFPFSFHNVSLVYCLRFSEALNHWELQMVKLFKRPSHICFVLCSFPAAIPLKSELAYEILDRGQVRFWLQAESISPDATYRFVINDTEVVNGEVNTDLGMGVADFVESTFAVKKTSSTPNGVDTQGCRPWIQPDESSSLGSSPHSASEMLQESGAMKRCCLLLLASMNKLVSWELVSTIRPVTWLCFHPSTYCQCPIRIRL